MSSLAAFPLTEEVPELGSVSPPLSPWSTLSTRPRSRSSRTISNGYTSKIPVLSGRYNSSSYYADPEEDAILVEPVAPLRFADPPPTLKELHAGGHKITQGLPSHEDNSDLGDNSPVWDEYCREAEDCDRELINELNGSLDVLLIFAGLFCAVLAALIVESYQMLLPDPQDQTLEVLHAILSTLQNNSHSYTLRSQTFEPSFSAIRVNILWFSSLSLALGVAVQVMLAKQWLHKYSEGLSNVPRLRMQLRQYRYDNLRKWALPETVNFLPTLLHLALALFLLGLIDWLWSIRASVAIMTLSICTLFTLIYISIMFLPHIYADCPYKTPFSRLLGLAYYNIRLLAHWLRHDSASPPRDIPLDKAEYQAVHAQRDVLQAKALGWLMKNSRNPTAIKTVAQSLASIPASFSAVYLLRQAGAIQRVAEHFLSCFIENQLPTECRDGTTVRFQLDEERSHEAGLYAQGLVGLIEGLPASRWPQRPPRELHLYSDVLISALSTLVNQTENAETVAFSIAAREHVFRAGRVRYPNYRARYPTHSLGDLLELVSKIADDELIPGVNGVACAIDTLRRWMEAATLEQRKETWTEFAAPLLRILSDTPPACRVRDSLSKCLACFAGLNHNMDYSDGNDPIDHRLIYALSILLNQFADSMEGNEARTQLVESIAEALSTVTSEYSRAFVHSIRSLGETLSFITPLLFTTRSAVVKSCVLQVIRHSDYNDLPPGLFSQLMALLRDKNHIPMHVHLARILDRHLPRPEISQYLVDTRILEGIIRLLSSSDESTRVYSSTLLNEICSMGLKTGGKAAQRTALEPLLKANLLGALRIYLLDCSARLISNVEIPTSHEWGKEDFWIPRLLALLELFPQEVLQSEAMDACVAYSQLTLGDAAHEETGKNLGEWWPRYADYVRSGSKAPKPRPKGPLYRR